jgi:hypothetical protein
MASEVSEFDIYLEIHFQILSIASTLCESMHVPSPSVPVNRRHLTIISFLSSTPVVFPFYKTYGVLRQSSAACKALKVLKTIVLKRLTSAVQLRPYREAGRRVAASPLGNQLAPNRLPRR